jgi:thymidylate kinase
MRAKRMIYVMGTDGAGKTTLTTKYVNELHKRGLNVSYLYARYFPFLSIPVKFLSKLIIYKKETEFSDFEGYSKKKSKFSEKHKIVSKIYILICLIDYILISFPRVYYKYIISDIIIVDRYLVDFIVTLSIAAKLNVSHSKILYQFIQKIFPIPTDVFFLEVSSKIAFSRKNDIPSLKYLEERKEFYYKFQEICNFQVLDGSKKSDELLTLLKNKLNL